MQLTWAQQRSRLPLPDHLARMALFDLQCEARDAVVCGLHWEGANSSRSPSASNDGSSSGLRFALTIAVTTAQLWWLNSLPRCSRRPN
jgi:hypothetical protein